MNHSTFDSRPRKKSSFLQLSLCWHQNEMWAIITRNRCNLKFKQCHNALLRRSSCNYSVRIRNEEHDMQYECKLCQCTSFMIASTVFQTVVCRTDFVAKISAKKLYPLFCKSLFVHRSGIRCRKERGKKNTGPKKNLEKWKIRSA